MQPQKRIGLIKLLGVHVLAFVIAYLAVQTAFAARTDIINNALNENLKERANVEKTWSSNPDMNRPDRLNRQQSGRIEVVIDSEVGSGSAQSRLKGFENPPTEREERVDNRLGDELEDLEREINPEST